MIERGGQAVASRRGRPTALRAASIDAQILSAARMLFLDAGFDAVSMEAVAAAARVSKGTLYARHPGKPDLLRALMADRIAAWSATARVDDHLLPPDLAGRLRGYASTIRSARHWHESRQMQRLVRGIAGDFPELAAEWHELTFGSFARFLSDEIAAAVAHDGLPATDPTFLASLFLNALGGWTEAADLSQGGGEDAYRDFADKLIATVVLAARAG